MLAILLVIIGYFVVGVLLDQLRKLFWDWVEPKVPDVRLYE